VGKYEAGAGRERGTYAVRIGNRLDLVFRLAGADEQAEAAAKNGLLRGQQRGADTRLEVGRRRLHHRRGIRVDDAGFRLNLTGRLLRSRIGV